MPKKIAFGHFAFPGVMVEKNETVKSTVCREALEEIGVKIKKKDVSVIHIFRLQQKYNVLTNMANQILTGYVTGINKWIGEPHNVEPEKHSKLGWFDIAKLPSNLFSLSKQLLNFIQQGIFYSENG